MSVATFRRPPALKVKQLQSADDYPTVLRLVRLMLVLLEHFHSGLQVRVEEGRDPPKPAPRLELLQHTDSVFTRV